MISYRYAYTAIFVAPLIAMGNTVVTIPSSDHPLSATDLYQVLETSDVPDGVINIVTGERDALAKILAEHDDVEAMWYFGSREGEGREFLRAATHVKNIWVPYGE